MAKLSPTGDALAYATFLGGTDSDGGQGIAVDGSGAAYVTGWTDSSDFPTTPGAYDTTFNGSYYDAFVVRLSPAGDALRYATFLGGSGGDAGWGIAVDGSGAAYVTGLIDSSDFPTTPGAYDTTYNGNGDAFVVRLSPAGDALAYATFLGGSGEDGGIDIAVDGSGAAYVTGDTDSSDFPTTPGAFDTTYNGGDYYQGDAFVVKLSPAGDALRYATFLGGSGGDAGWGIAVDGSGAVYVTGETDSSDFPTTPGAYDTTLNGYIDDAFVVKLALGGGPATLVPQLDSRDPLHKVILRGSVDPKGGTVQVWFEWGPDPNLSTYQITGTQVITGGLTTITATLALPSEDSVGMPYFYRIAAGDPANPIRGDVQRILILLGTGSAREWSKYDRLIHYYAHAWDLPATVVKAMILHESEGLGYKSDRAFLYEPGLDVRYAQPNTYFLPYRLPGNPAPLMPYKLGREVVLPAQVTIGQMMREYRMISHYNPTYKDSTAIAQYRLASSYGLGQIVYLYDYCFIENPGTAPPFCPWPPQGSQPAPEKLYEPDYNIRAMVKHLNSLRNRCNRNLGEGDWQELTPWAPTVKAYNGGHWGCGARANPAYFPSVAAHFSRVQPVIAPQDFDATQILSPTLPAKPRGVLGTIWPEPGEYEVDRLVADVKGSGHLQLLALYVTITDASAGVDYGKLKIFTDQAGSAVEWESPPMEGVLSMGKVFTQTLPGEEPPLICAFWGIGAHGSGLHLFRWNGQTYQPIVGTGSGGEEISRFFGDAGVSIQEGRIQVGNRDAIYSLSTFHIDSYEWQPSASRFGWVSRETVNNIERIFLPLVLRGR